MITAVDTNVLLDVFLPDERHGPRSTQWLRSAYDNGAILVCDIVYSELVPAFGDRAALDDVLRGIGGEPSPIDTGVAFEAGVRWRRYRQAGGPRNRRRGSGGPPAAAVEIPWHRPRRPRRSSQATPIPSTQNPNDTERPWRSRDSTGETARRRLEGDARYTTFEPWCRASTPTPIPAPAPPNKEAIDSFTTG